MTMSSFALGYLSWRYVERPFRDKTRIISINRVTAIFGILTIIFLVIGAIGHYTNGFRELMFKYKYTNAQQRQLTLVSSAIDAICTLRCHRKNAIFGPGILKT